MKRMNGPYRHGDILLIARKALPVSAIAQPRRGDVILAEGEATGHAHRIAEKSVVLWSSGDQRYLTVEGPATLTHEEHGAIPLPAGIYEVLRQRVYTPEAVQWVRD